MEINNFIKELNDLSSENDIIIPDMGQTGCIAFQKWNVKKGQLFFNGINYSPMGYSIPGAIGASFACHNKQRVIVIIGDGSLMMNLQELQTIKEFNLQIKIFVVENNGYGMIKQTQNDWESLKKGIACDKKHHLSFPNIEKISKAFDIKYTSVKNAFKIKEPTITSIKIKNMKISPKVKFGEKLW